MNEQENSTPDEPTHVQASPELSTRHQEALERFILFWGEMASSWGINRTMAQIHALLYASENPLDTDEIMERLQISRGNANMNLRSLINWNLVRKIHLSGSRKDYYTAEKDVWEITSQIVREREKREIRPVMQQLEECRTILSKDDHPLDDSEEQFKERIESLMQLMQVFEGVSKSFLPLIQKRNAAMIRQLIGFATMLQERTGGAEDREKG
jgi:DNA-binding transcriptional regulator GbsR (MarR family)